MTSLQKTVSAETETEAPPNSPGDHTGDDARYVGARVRRVEDPRFLTGRARYLDNIDVPNVLHAAFVRSPIAHGLVRGIDATNARAARGVRAVFTAADFADEITPLVTDMHQDEVAVLSRTALASEKVCHVGDPVAVVIATSRYLAEDACDQVVVDYAPLEPVMDARAAMTPESPRVNEGLGHNVLAHLEGQAGDVEAAFAAADHIFVKRFQHGRSTAAPLEGRGVLGQYDVPTGHLTVYSSSQIPHLLRTVLAATLKMPETQLTVISPDVGGGFGLKCHPFPEDAIIAASARRLQSPVKWIEDRYEDLAAGVHSKEMFCEMELATTADGVFVGLRAHYVSDAGAYGAGITNALVDVINAATGLPSLYDVPNLAYTADAALTNKCAVGAVRGVGWSPGQTIRETLVEDAARQLGIDPVELRLMNCIGPEPRENAFGAKYDGGSYAAALELARDRVGYEAFRGRQHEERERGRYLGVGFSAYIEPGGLGCAGSAANRLPIPFYDLASVTVEPDGSVTVSTGLHSHGQGHETSLAQVAADELGVTVERVRSVFGNTDTAVWGTGTFASRSAVIGSGSIMLAARIVARRLRDLAAILLQADPDAVELRRGFASVRDDPTRSLTIGEVAGFGYFGAGARPKEVQESGLTATHGYDPLETYSNGAVAAIVEVDVETGFTTIEDIQIVEDCGVMLNPMIVDGQIAGAIAQGIGIALLEETAYGPDGQFLAGSLMDYLYPSTTEVPEFGIAHLETPSPVSINGVKGMGESGVIGAPAAILNAIVDALVPFDVQVDRTPVTPSYLRDLLRESSHR
jgi:CO/xanthine dehydrogenase Mo-binding subunit